MSEAGDSGAVAVSTEWWRETRGLTGWLTWLLPAAAVITVIAVWAIDLAEDLVRTHRGLDAVFDGRSDDAQRIFEQMNTGFGRWNPLWLVSSATIVLVVVWMWRSVHNARALGRQGRRVGPAGAIVGWIIPIASWILPYLVFSDLWRSSDPSSGRGDGWRSLPGSALVRGYWAVYLAGQVCSGVAIICALAGVFDVDQTRSLLRVGALVNAAALLLLLPVVRTITARQERLQLVDPAPTERPVVPSPVPVTGAPGWYDDPTGRADHRWWDGGLWTEHVATAGVASTDAVVAPGWYPDPRGRFDRRYWGDAGWTDQVSDGRGITRDPL